MENSSKSQRNTVLKVSVNVTFMEFSTLVEEEFCQEVTFFFRNKNYIYSLGRRVPAKKCQVVGATCLLVMHSLCVQPIDREHWLH